MKSVILWMTFTMMVIPAYGQFSIAGKIIDAETEEPLVGANIVLRENSKGASSGSDGNFEIINLKQGKYLIIVSFIGYQDFEEEIELTRNINLNILLKPRALRIEGFVVEATRVGENSATAYTTLDKEKLSKNNLGQDFPYLLDNTPGVVSFSDAGAGIGYSGLRIRGSDPSRVNVTINGIPLNDSESQGVFWVDLPDFASSVQSVQIQRGVGTSTNGSGAFGASINIETGLDSVEPLVQIDNSLGSFNSRKHTLAVSTGLIKEKLSLNIRLSEIASDGYIERASSLLKSYFVSGTYSGIKNNIKLNIFSGKEVTYQAWDGVSDFNLQTDRTFNATGQIGPNSFYDNQVDDYNQNHYQLHYNYSAISNLALALSLHYTKGKGFFEQYRVDDDFADYGFNDIVIGTQVISSSDLIRRRWLDNDFYGTTFSAIYAPGSTFKVSFGGSANIYDGDHFGEIIWAQFAGNSTNSDHYYDNTGRKTELNLYLKPEINISSQLFVFGDIQFRNVSYEVNGIDNDQRILNTDKQFDFFNPKIGVSFRINSNTLAYASYGRANREPDRNDFIDSQDGAGPKHETLNDFEAGFRYSASTLKSEINLYSMQYENQLVLTGELNDVGTPIRINVDQSHRTGAELSFTWSPLDKLEFSGNAAYSVNKIKEFEETAPIFDPVFNYLRDSVITYADTDIILSPSWVAFGQITCIPLSGLEFSFNGKYVAEQFLDNKSNNNRKLDAFLLNNLNMSFTRNFSNSIFRKIRISLLLNNLFNVRYEPNGYSYFIFFDDGSSVFQDNYNFYYPQAGFNFLGGVSLTF
jgi:iron complex outermembrane receptor protein